MSFEAHQRPSLFQRLGKVAPGGELIRYLCVGVFNTLFGFATFAIIFTLLSSAVSPRYASLVAPLAAVISTPLNITVAYLGYKFFVFRTHGRYLVEWLKCFAVYGTGMLPGLFALGTLTRLLQSVIHGQAVPLHAALAAVEAHLSGRTLAFIIRIATNTRMSGYIAGAITTGFSTIFSFLGHKNVTFKQKPVAP